MPVCWVDLGVIRTAIVFSSPNAQQFSLASAIPTLTCSLLRRGVGCQHLPHVRLGYAKLPCNLRRFDPRFSCRTNGLAIPRLCRMQPHKRSAGMVESRMGAVAWAMRQRSVSHPPLIEPDVRISCIRLSDWLQREAHGASDQRALRVDNCRRLARARPIATPGALMPQC
jgi:hypothetical protein